MTTAHLLAAHGESALHLAARRSLGGESESLPYISGSAVRGSLAAAFLGSATDPSPLFPRLIEECRFGNLYPVSDPTRRSAPAPRSMVTCARVPGCRGDGGHGASDTLVLAEAARLSQETSGAPARLPLVTCAACAAEGVRSGAAIGPLGGFIEWADDGPHAVTPGYETTLQRPARGVQAANVLRRPLAAGQHFTGALLGADAAVVAAIEQALDAQERFLWVGSGRSRGLGALRLHSLRLMTPPDDLATRQASLAQALVAASAPKTVALSEDEHYFSVTLLAPALLQDAFGRWRSTLDAANLALALDLPEEALAVRQANVATVSVEGWNAALDLPKPDALGIAAGSAWLLRLRGVALDRALAAFASLEDMGLGERRQEGFGTVRVCDPVHWRVQQLEGDGGA